MHGRDLALCSVSNTVVAAMNITAILPIYFPCHLENVHADFREHIVIITSLKPKSQPELFPCCLIKLPMVTILKRVSGRP